MPKKKFIDKKKAVTFHLIHRSQHDPLTADESAPQRVLVPAENKITKKNKEEERKYGIYFDDDYNYLQHLRNVEQPEVVWAQDPSQYPKSTKSKINLPSSLFASEVEEDVGLLNKAAPTGLRLDLDPDIVAAMDDDFDYSNEENVLEDNFMELANWNDGDPDDVVSDYDDETCDDVKLSDFEDDNETRFTEYSMTSSVVTRNTHLTQLDDEFEQMFAEYDNIEIGALDCDNIEGNIDINSDAFKSAMEEFSSSKKSLKDMSFGLSYKDILRGYDSEEDVEETDRVQIKQKEKWDCESILSTYSNLYNHPQLIKEPSISKISVDKKTGIPLDGTKLTKKSLAQFDRSDMKSAVPSVISKLSTLSIRNKCESIEQKRDRKKQIKQYRKERRMEKKANMNAFKEEKKKMEKTMVNNKLRCQGLVL